MRSIFTGAKKCGGEKPHKGRSPAAVFRSPSRPTGGEAHTDLLGDAPDFFIRILFLSFFLVF
jgi:hypothetical protein